MTTAVADSLSDLFPADKYEVTGNVAILDEHERPEGYLGRDKLQAIADRLNDRIEDSSDYTPIIVRHTPDNDSDPQPPVIGYAGPFEVKKFGAKNPRWAIYAKNWIVERAEKAVAQKHPRRSVELAIDRTTKQPSHINSIALLGAEAPRRMLGLKLSDRDGYEVERYAMPMGKESEQKPQQSPFSALQGDDALIAKILAALEQTDVFVWVRQQQAMQATKDSQNPEDDENGGGEFAGAENEDVDPAAEAAGKQEKPDMSSDKKPDSKADKMSDNTEVERYKAEVDKYKADLDAASARIAALEKANVRAERVDKLRDLADKGLAFDLEDAKSEVDKMESAGEFDRYVAMLEKHCTKIPIDHALPAVHVDKLKATPSDKDAAAIAERTNEIAEKLRVDNPSRDSLERYKEAKKQAEREFAAAK